MSKLYRKFLYVPEDEKVSDRAIVRRAVFTFTVIIICLAGMCVSAYASYYHSSVMSKRNVIRTARFDTEVTVSGGAEVVEVTDGMKLVMLEPGLTYTVTIGRSDGCTAATGFVIMTAFDGAVTYHTAQIGADASVPGGKTDHLIFQIRVEALTALYFESHWGTSSYYPQFVTGEYDKEFYVTSERTGDNMIRLTADGQKDTSVEGTEGTEGTDSTDGPEVTEKPEEDLTEGTEVTEKPEEDLTEAPEVTVTDVTDGEGDVGDVDTEDTEEPADTAETVVTTAERPGPGDEPL